jgi:hypothetical protein
MFSSDILATLVQLAQVLATGVPISLCLTATYLAFRQALNAAHRLAQDLLRTTQVGLLLAVGL